MYERVEKVKLGEICLSITDGKHGDCKNESGSGYYFISAKDVKGGKINYENAREIEKSDFEETHRRTKLEPLDILIANSGTIGRMAVVSKSEKTFRTTFQKSVAILKPSHEQVLSEFLYYALLFRKKILIEVASGTAQKNLLLGDLRRFNLFLPSLDIQKKITAVLSAYDDLIENNNKRIALLEKGAEEIYREWFVRLRFPGWETAVFHKGIPEDWEVERLDFLGKVVTGKTPSKKVSRFHDGPILFIKTPDMHGNLYIHKTADTLTVDGMMSQPSQTIPAKSICVSCIGTGGVVSITASECQTNQQINSIVLSEQKNLEWAFFTVRNLKEMIKLFGGTGATMTNLSKGKFSALKIIVPTVQFRDTYHAYS